MRFRRRRAGAWTAPSWVLRVADINAQQEWEFGGGGQGSISPNGQLVAHNQGDRQRAIIRNFDGSEYKTIYTPEGSFNLHRWSHSENEYVLIYH